MKGLGRAIRSAWDFSSGQLTTNPDDFNWERWEEHTHSCTASCSVKGYVMRGGSHQSSWRPLWEEKRDVALFAWAALTKQWWWGGGVGVRSRGGGGGWRWRNGVGVGGGWDGSALSIWTPHNLGVWDCFPLKLVDKIASSFFFQPLHLIFLPCPEFLLSPRQTAVILDCDCSRNSSVSMPVAPGAEFNLGGQSQTWQC